MTPDGQEPDRNRTTVRRALSAGLVGGVFTALVLVPTSFSDNPPGGAVILSSALAVAALVTAGWLLLAAGLDLVAGARMDRRRAAWTVAATLLALFMPFLVLGTLTQAATRGGAG